MSQNGDKFTLIICSNYSNFKVIQKIVTLVRVTMCNLSIIQVLEKDII